MTKIIFYTFLLQTTQTIFVKTLYCIEFHNIFFMIPNSKKQFKIVFIDHFKSPSENNYEENVNCIVIVYYFASSLRQKVEMERPLSIAKTYEKVQFKHYN